ncbi:MAG: hypothetical protein F6K17_36520, partial [Okeania sp. SIO3C4]|nr:hypothetical protein [Okeania sp. SIO3C4]
CSNSTRIGATFNNTGELQVNQGNLELDSGGNSNGSFRVGAGNYLEFGGAHRLENSSSVTGAGNIQFSSDTSNIAGTYNITGLTEINSGGATFGGNSTVTNLKIQRGTTTFNNNQTMTNLELAGGTLTGTGDITIDTFNWSGGTLSGSGTTTVNQELNISGGSNKFIDSRTLTNKGTGIWKSTGPVLGSNGAVFNNSGSLDIQSDADWVRNSGDSPTFNNSGTLVKSGGSTEGSNSTRIGATFNNTGELQVNQGNLELDSGGNSNGNFSVGAGNSLEFGGTHALLSGYAVSGDGTVILSRSDILDVSSDGGVNFDPGTFDNKGGTFKTS